MTDLERMPKDLPKAAKVEPGDDPVMASADIVTLATLDALEDLADGYTEPESYGLVEDLEPMDVEDELY